MERVRVNALEQVSASERERSRWETELGIPHTRLGEPIVLPSIDGTWADRCEEARQRLTRAMPGGDVDNRGAGG